MDDIRKILEENIENYGLECRKLEGYISENEEIFKAEGRYAECLSEPLKDKQILFWCKGQRACADTPRYIFDYLYRTYGNEYTYIWVTKTNKDLPQGLPKEVVFVKKNSGVYWEALACSKYLIGNVMLPAAFAKRKGQVYVNSMLGMDGLFKKRTGAVLDEHSLLLKEMLKTDFLISDSQWMTERLYEEEYRLDGVYCGTIINNDSRAAYMGKKGHGRNDKGKCVLLIQNERRYQWFLENWAELENGHQDLKLVRDNCCFFEGQDICDILAQCDLVISDGSNYLRAAKAYGCKACCLGEKDAYLGLEEFEQVGTPEELRDYIARNADYRREQTDTLTDDIGRIADLIFHSGKDGLSRGKQGQKKNLLILTDWNLPRERQYMMKQIVSSVDREKYDVTVASPAVDSPYTAKEMEECLPGVRKILYHGRMVLGSEEYILFWLIKKNPDLYLKNQEIRNYMNVLMQREWVRMWGELPADIILLFGESLQQYFITLVKQDAKKILAAEEFLQNRKEEDIEKWRAALKPFDKIYVSAACAEEKLDEYGEENKGKVERLPLRFPTSYTDSDSVDCVSIRGRECLIADRWRSTKEREQMYLISMPASGSCLVNAQLCLDENRKQRLGKLLEGEESICFVGERAEDYRKQIGGKCEVMDLFIRKNLYMLPTARAFFERISCYYGDERLEYDALEEICKEHNVKVCS